MQPVFIAPPQITLKLHEWQRIGPQDEQKLAGYYFREPFVREEARRINDAGQVGLLELREGLTIQTRQYVGSLQLGDLRITILPKIKGMPLLNLLHYTYHLRKFDFFNFLDFGTDNNEFQDILIQQLAIEAAELLERGLYRRYKRVNENLVSPRGRIDFGNLAGQGGLTEATLPCAHFVRLEDNPLNQSLLAGLLLASRMTMRLELRTKLRQSARILSQSVSKITLTSRFLSQVITSINRLTRAYLPALQLIQLLLDGQSLSLEDDQAKVHLPGFLFDMNRFFQGLLDRFLRENLEGYTLQSEYQLHRMLGYHPQHNPYGWSAPKPRPDFAILSRRSVIALLDAKYCDIGQYGLPREMLYQLAFYASGQGRPGLAAILYPTVTGGNETWLDITHPVYGDALARVILRPVNLYELERVITSATQPERSAFAQQMVFGEKL